MRCRRRQLALIILQFFWGSNFDFEFPFFGQMIGLEEWYGYLIANRLLVDTVKSGRVSPAFTNIWYRIVAWNLLRRLTFDQLWWVFADDGVLQEVLSASNYFRGVSIPVVNVRGERTDLAHLGRCKSFGLHIFVSYFLQHRMILLLLLVHVVEGADMPPWAHLVQCFRAKLVLHGHHQTWHVDRSHQRGFLVVTGLLHCQWLNLRGRLLLLGVLHVQLIVPLVPPEVLGAGQFFSENV